MRNWKKTLWVFALVVLAASACNKEDEPSANDCYTCSDCQGQYGNLINGEYCVDGFDSRADWQAAREEYENEENQCTCVDS